MDNAILMDRLYSMNKEELLDILSHAIIEDHLLKEKIMSYVNKKQQLVTEPLRMVENNIISDNFDTRIILDNNLKENGNVNNMGNNKKKEKRNKKVFSIDSYHQRQIALQVQYDGENYLGFASQVQEDSLDNNNINNNTIEFHLFEAFIKLKLIKDRKTCKYSRCGRTDKGVNALGQIISLKVRSAIPKEIDYIDNNNNEIDMNKNDDLNDNSISDINKQTSSLYKNTEIQEIDYCSMINNCLPVDIRVLGWCAVTDEFDARFSAASRTYRYFFLRKNLNIINMQQAASFLVGIHDFRNLCKMDIVNVTNFKREIYYAEIKPFHSTTITTINNNNVNNNNSSTIPTDSSSNNNYDNNNTMYMLEIKGVAFLWHMIRCIMAVLFMVGEGCESPTIVQSLLDVANHPCKPTYMMAPEQPLVLHECSYDNLNILPHPKNLWQLTAHYYELLEYHYISTALICNTLQWITSQSVRKDDIDRFIVGLLEHRQKQEKSVAIAISKYNNHNNIIENHAKKSKYNDDQTIVHTHDDNNNTQIPVNNNNITNEINMTNLTQSHTNTIQWMNVLKELLTTYHLVPKIKTIPYVPLMNRHRGNAYEDRVNHLSHKKKVRLDRHLSLSQAVSSQTPIFFQTMRNQGSIA